MNEPILMDPEICHGKPVVRGTRVPVARVLSYLAGGMTMEEVVRDYDLTPDDVLAALEYAAELVDSEQQYPLPT